MTSYQVDDTDKVQLFDNKTGGFIINCTKLAVVDSDGNSDECEFINCRQPMGLYGEWAKAIMYDDMPSPREVNRDAEAFVQYASAIASALDKGKKAVVFCKNGRSRSPCVVAAFYIIYRGLSLFETKMWFKEVYPRQRPITAEKSSNFPNIEKFEAVLNLLEICLANPQKTVRGFNLADVVAKCSKAHGTPLQLAGSIKSDHLDYYSVPPSLREVVFTSKSNCHSPVGVLTREARRKEVQAQQNPKEVLEVADGVDNWAELIDWYYVHPNFANQGISEIMKKGKEGEDYFINQESVMRYAKKYPGFRGAAETTERNNNKPQSKSRQRTATAAATAERIEKKKEKKNSKSRKKQSVKNSKKEESDTKGEKAKILMHSNENEIVSDGSCFSEVGSGGGFGPFSPTVSEAEADIALKSAQKRLTYRVKQQMSTPEAAKESASSGDDCSATYSASNGTEIESDDSEVSSVDKTFHIMSSVDALSSLDETMRSSPESKQETPRKQKGILNYFTRGVTSVMKAALTPDKHNSAQREFDAVTSFQNDAFESNSISSTPEDTSPPSLEETALDEDAESSVQDKVAYSLSHDQKYLPWAELWKEMRIEGWRCMPGNGLTVCYYYAHPRCAGMKKTEVLSGKKGLDYFESEEEIQEFAKKHLGWRGEKWLSTPGEAMMKSSHVKASAVHKRKQRNAIKEVSSFTKKSRTYHRLKQLGASEIDTKLAPHQFCERLCLVKSSSDTDFAFTPGRAGPDQTVSVNKLWPALKFHTFNELMDQINMMGKDPKAIKKMKARFTVEAHKLLKKAGVLLSNAGFAYLLGKGNQSTNFLTLLRKNDSGELIEDGVIFDFFDSKIEMERSEGYCSASDFQHAYKIALARMEAEESGDDMLVNVANANSAKKTAETDDKTMRVEEDRKGALRRTMFKPDVPVETIEFACKESAPDTSSFGVDYPGEQGDGDGGENQAGKKSPKVIRASPVANGVDNWTEMWNSMQTQGWSWISGDGLVDWYYVHPNFANRGKSEIMKKGKKGVDYFINEESVMRYAKKYLGFRGAVATPASNRNKNQRRSRKRTAAATVERIEKKKEKKNSTSGKKQSNKKSKKKESDTKGKKKTKIFMPLHENESVSDSSRFSEWAGGGFGPNSPTVSEAEAAQKRLTYREKRTVMFTYEENASDISSLL